MELKGDKMRKLLIVALVASISTTGCAGVRMGLGTIFAPELREARDTLMRGVEFMLCEKGEVAVDSLVGMLVLRFFAIPLGDVATGQSCSDAHEFRAPCSADDDPVCIDISRLEPATVFRMETQVFVAPGAQSIQGPLPQSGIYIVKSFEGKGVNR